jgi:hypothetical protein
MSLLLPRIYLFDIFLSYIKKIYMSRGEKKKFKVFYLRRSHYQLGVLYVDYLFVAFTGATALSPADTYLLTQTAKGLMMVEALLSMLTIVILAGGAVNIL